MTMLDHLASFEPGNEEGLLEAQEKGRSAASYQWRKTNFASGPDWGEGVNPWVELILGRPAPCPANLDFRVPGLEEEGIPSFRELALALWRPLWDLGVVGGAK